MSEKTIDLDKWLRMPHLWVGNADLTQTNGSTDINDAFSHRWMPAGDTLVRLETSEAIHKTATPSERRN